MKTVRMGIVGIGNIGTAHLFSIGEGHIEGMNLSAVCDINKDRLEFALSKFPDVKTFTDVDEMIDSGLIDALIVSVPHPFHALIAEKALKKGLHVLTEKPEDIKVSAAEELNEIAEKSGCVFGIMFNQRTNPLFAKAREMVKSGKLGELKRSVWIITNWYRTQDYYDSGAWRATWKGEGGGVLLNQAPHNLDLWQWICGMPSEIFAVCDVAKYHNIEVEDDVAITARYENGALGTFITSTGEYPGTNRLEISGDRGKIVIENGILKFWELSESEREYCFRKKKPGEELSYTYSEMPQTEKETGHRGILRDFANSILNDTKLLAPGKEGINELSISNAAYLSSWTGEWVKFPLDTDKFDRLLSEKQSKGEHESVNTEEDKKGEYLPRWQVNW